MAPATTPCSRPIPAKAGIGSRFQHHQALIDYRPDVAWFEIHTENYMGGGAPLRYLDAIRRDFPVSLHGIGLSLGLKADQQRLGESPGQQRTGSKGWLPALYRRGPYPS